MQSFSVGEQEWGEGEGEDSADEREWGRPWALTRWQGSPPKELQAEMTQVRIYVLELLGSCLEEKLVAEPSYHFNFFFLSKFIATNPQTRATQ